MLVLLGKGVWRCLKVVRLTTRVLCFLYVVTPTAGDSRRHKEGARMDYISEGERQKLYYQGLKKASEYHLPDEVLSVIQDNLADPRFGAVYHETVSLNCNVLAPLHRVISFIINNRLIHEYMGEIVAQAKENTVLCTADDIFLSLCSVEPYMAEEIIRTIDTDSATLEHLRRCYQNRDRQAFAAVINENHCGLQVTSLICKDICPDTSAVFSQPFEDLFTTMDALAVTNGEELDDNAQMLLRSAECMTDEALKIMHDDDGDAQRYFVAQYENAKNTLAWLRGLYTDNIKSFKLRERRIIEAILARPESTAIPVTNDNDGDGFSLPVDYFSQMSGLSHSDEHFNLRHEVVAAGAERFTELINYLSESGYIENSLAVKQLFAYRFSGRMRPEKVEPIEWRGENGNSYELIYLVRNLTERANYRKMRNFFTGPKWVKDRDSSYARGADYHLKAYLHQLYPTLPDQL